MEGGALLEGELTVTDSLVSMTIPRRKGSCASLRKPVMARLAASIVQDSDLLRG